MVRHIGSTDGAKINCAEWSKEFEAILRHHHAVLFVVARAPRKSFYLKLKIAGLLCERMQDFKAGSDHFWANAIRRDSRNGILAHFRSSKQTAC